MSIRPKESIRSYWNNNLDTNGANAITGEKLNTGGIDIIDSTMPRTYQFPISGDFTLDGYSQEAYFDGGFVIWSDTANRTFALGDALGTNCSFKVYNVSSNYTLTFTGGSGVSGDTVLNSGETAWVYKLAGGSWLITKYSTASSLGYGTKYVNSAGIQITPPASTWYEIPLPASYGTQDLANVSDVANNRLKLVNVAGNLLSQINGFISVQASSNNGGHTLLLAYGVNGNVPAKASNIASETSIGAVSTSIFLPMSMSASTVLNVDDEISLFVYTNVSESISINRLNLNINYKKI